MALVGDYENTALSNASNKHPALHRYSFPFRHPSDHGNTEFGG
jgi:hypothetical protein